jgi:hypothetical protein
MKPIHKFNNGRGATLCNQCSVIITTDLTDDLYCNKCRKEMLQDIMKDDEALGLYFEQMEKEELKQETENLKNFKKLVSDEISPAMKDFIKEKQEILEEAYLNQLIDEGNKEFTLDRKLAKDVAIKYANWQAERMYSEENVFQFFEKYREDFSIHRNIQVLPSQFEQWFEQFKKK